MLKIIFTPKPKQFIFGNTTVLFPKIIQKFLKVKGELHWKSEQLEQSTDRIEILIFRVSKKLVISEINFWNELFDQLSF